MCHRNQIFPCKEMSWSHLTPRSSSPPEADALWPPNPFILQPGSREVAVLPGWGSRMPGGGRPETGPVGAAQGRGNSAAVGPWARGCAHRAKGTAAPAGERHGWTGLARARGGRGAGRGDGNPQGGEHLGLGAQTAPAPSTAQPQGSSQCWPSRILAAGSVQHSPRGQRGMGCSGKGGHGLNNPNLFVSKSQGPSG